MTALVADEELVAPLADWDGDAQALAGDRMATVPLDNGIAVDAALLDGEGAPQDPAGRIILTTARRHGGRLVTRDERLRAFAPERPVW